eukprot:Colp12_sorted_trinity150504_noHs@163
MTERVQTLLKRIERMHKNGCKTILKGITCRPCVGTTMEGSSGYYDSNSRRVVICCDHIKNEEDLNDTVVHELIHAYDRCRSFGDFSNLYNRACSEVRASSIGQCDKVTFAYRKRACVRQEAINSMRKHTATPAEFVEAVFEQCYADKTPF